MERAIARPERETAVREMAPGDLVIGLEFRGE